MQQMVIVIYQFTHPHWHDYYYESSCTHKQRQAQMDTLTNVILRARVPGPHAVGHRVHHRGLKGNDGISQWEKRREAEQMADLAVVPHYDLRERMANECTATKGVRMTHLVLRRHYVGHPARSYPLLVRASVLL
jgi:hypothetical protein